MRRKRTRGLRGLGGSDSFHKTIARESLRFSTFDMTKAKDQFREGNCGAALAFIIQCRGANRRSEGSHRWLPKRIRVYLGAPRHAHDYLIEWRANGYEKNKYEIEARAAE